MAVKKARIAVMAFCDGGAVAVVAGSVTIGSMTSSSSSSASELGSIAWQVKSSGLGLLVVVV